MANKKKRNKNKRNHNSYTLKKNDNNLLHKKLFAKIVIILMISAFVIPVVFITLYKMFFG